MPTKVVKIKDGDIYTGALGFVHTCDNCQKPACIGYGFDSVKAIELQSQGDNLAYQALGRWYCIECDKKK